ncbi:MAG: hypothetical protein ACOX6O_06795 [Christensenellales bacterium]|jgi:hypothetical protein
MNIIADRLFGLLLGWTRGLFNSLWNLVTNHSSGITGFLQRFWLPMIVILLMAGTITDYVVWIIRWRPHYVWRSWFSRRDRSRRMQATQAYMADLDQAPLDLGYDQGDEPYFYPQDQAVTFPENDSFPYSQEPVYQEPPISRPPQPLMQQTPSFTPAYPEHELPHAAWIAEPEAQPQALWQEPLPPEEAVYQPAWDEAVPHEPEEETVPEIPASPRRRRVDTKRQRQPGLLRAIRETFIDPMDPDEQLDSLPPPISPEDAFHQPYYPENYSYRLIPQEEDNNKL